MISKTNILKSIIICALCSAVYNYYFATDMFVQQLTTTDHTPGRLDAFITMSKVTEAFWPRIFKGWLQSFVLTLFACIALMLWLKPSVCNKSSKSSDAENAPSM